MDGSSNETRRNCSRFFFDSTRRQYYMLSDLLFDETKAAFLLTDRMEGQQPGRHGSKLFQRQQYVI